MKQLRFPNTEKGKKVPDVMKKKNFRRYGRVIYNTARRNFSAVVFTSTLMIGGLTLLMYALSIEQLPEFTWNDLTGTLFAVCTTGVLVVSAVVMYCLCAGYYTRAALEAVYPEAAHHVSGLSRDSNSPIEPYAQLIRAPFILGATCFSILAWTGLFINFSGERLISPYNERLTDALIIALVAIVILLLFDWRRFPRQWARYAILSIFGGAVVMLVIIITAWSVGPDNLVTKNSTKSSEISITINWKSYCIAALDHSVAIGIFATIFMMILLNFRTTFLSTSRLLRWQIKLIPWKSPVWLARILTRTSQIVAGKASDRRLIKAKIIVTGVFFLFTFSVFMMAYAMAGMGDAHDWSMNFFFIVVLLTALNWASFSVGHWKGRAGLGIVTATMVFLSYPLFVHNPVMFPKMVVSLLGLGNERLVTIALSSKQCATLAPYGVSCVTDNEKAITLTNVNMLSRLGSSIVLELLIKDDDADARTATSTSKLTGRTAQPLNHGRPEEPMAKFLVATAQMGARSPSARFCDTLLLSQLDVEDTIHAGSLRCVELVVPKDQVLGYTKSNWRSYRGEYTAYQTGPAKAPIVVKVLGDKVGGIRKEAAFAVITTTQ